MNISPRRGMNLGRFCLYFLLLGGLAPIGFGLHLSTPKKALDLPPTERDYYAQECRFAPELCRLHDGHYPSPAAHPVNKAGARAASFRRFPPVRRFHRQPLGGTPAPALDVRGVVNDFPSMETLTFLPRP